MASTTGIETWAQDLAEVGPIYPFQGTETVLVIIAVVLWVGWHVVQLIEEKRENAEKVRRHGNAETIHKAIDKHGD